MIVFQVLGLTLLAALAALTVGAAVRGKLRRRSAALWLLVWTAAAAAIAVPELTMIVAHALGIGRGADLVLYCTILAILVGFFFLFARLRRLEEDLTRLVRHLAIREAAEESEVQSAFLKEGLERVSPRGSADPGSKASLREPGRSLR